MLKNLITLIIVEAVTWGLHFLFLFLTEKIRDKAVDKHEKTGKASVVLNTLFIIIGFLAGVMTIISYAAIVLWLVSSWVKVFAVLGMLVIIVSIIWGYATSYFAMVDISLTAAPSKAAPVISYLIIGVIASYIVKLSSVIFVGAFEMADGVYNIMALVVDIILLIVTVAVITAAEIKQKECANKIKEADDVQ